MSRAPSADDPAITAIILIADDDDPQSRYRGLCALACQRYLNWRIIFVGGCAKAAEVAKLASHSFRRWLPKHSVFTPKEALSLVAMRNAGLTHVKTPHVLAMHVTDMLHPAALTVFADAIKAQPQAAHHGLHSSIDWYDYAFLPRVSETDPWTGQAAPGGEPMVYPTDALWALGGFMPSDSKLGAEWPTRYALLDRAVPFVRTPAVLCFRRDLPPTPPVPKPAGMLAPSEPAELVDYRRALIAKEWPHREVKEKTADATKAPPA